MPRSGSSRMAMSRSCCTRQRQWPPSIASGWLSHRSKKSSSRPWEASAMHNVMLIARREYLEQVRGRAFRLSTIGLPALFAVIIGVGYVASLGLGANKHLVIMANDAALADAIRTQIVSDKDGTPNVDVVAPAKPDSRAQL